MRIINAMALEPERFAALASEHGAELVQVAGEQAILAELGSSDALWISPAEYTERLRDALAADASTVRWVQLQSMGFDQVEALGAPHGVSITNAGDAYAPIVAEHAVALILAALRGIPASVRDQQQGRWAEDKRGEVASLIGRTVGIYGYGNIGRETAARLKPFGCRIAAITPDAKVEGDVDLAFDLDRRTEGFAVCDVLIVAAPLNDGTRGAIGKDAFDALPDHALVVNIGRGEVVDTPALRVALESRSIGGAALDVIDPEPLPSDDALWRDERVLITPHVAGFAQTVTAERLAAVVGANLAAFVAGKPAPTQIEV